MDDVRSRLVEEFAAVFERETVMRAHDLSLVKAVVHDGGGRVLLLHRLAHDFWQPVTGRLEPGELAAQAAAREVTEETGCEVGKMADLLLRQSFLIDEQFVSGAAGPLFTEEHSFAAKVDPKSIIRLDSEEHDRWQWFTFPEAYATIRWTDDREAIERLSVH